MEAVGHVDLSIEFEALQPLQLFLYLGYISMTRLQRFVDLGVIAAKSDKRLGSLRSDRYWTRYRRIRLAR